MSGLSIALAGLPWPMLSKLPLGRMPGDLIVEKPGIELYFPITTMILVGVVPSSVARLLRR